MCKEGFGGPRCDKCLDGFYDFPNCNPCECSEEGSSSDICDVKNGQCPCKYNYGGRQCSQCSSGYFNYPVCEACNCYSFGSIGKQYVILVS